MTYDREAAAAVAAALRHERQAAGGRLPDGALAEAARLLGVTRPTLSRWISVGVPGERRQSARLDLEARDDLRPVLYEKNASLAAAHRQLERDLQPEALPSLRTLQRAFRRLPASERDAIRAGEVGWRQHRPVQRYEAEFRNQHWQGDHQQLDIWVRPPGKRRAPLRPWLTVFIDAYSRAIMGYALSVRPNQGHVLAALGAAMRVYPERGPFGGVPRWLTTDRGMEFMADAVLEALVMFRITAMPTLPRHPEHNGKVERLHRTAAQTLLADLPGYTGGATDRAKQPLTGAHILPLDQFAARLAEWVDDYNLRRPHKGLDGDTPLTVWERDPTELALADEAMLRRYQLKGTPRVVRRGKIAFDGHLYLPGPGAAEGHELDLRHDVNDTSTVELYDGDRHVTTATREDMASEAVRDAWIEHHKEMAERHRRDLREARRRSRRTYRAISDAQRAVETTQTPAELPPKVREQRRAAARRRALNLDFGKRTSGKDTP